MEDDDLADTSPPFYAWKSRSALSPTILRAEEVSSRVKWAQLSPSHLKHGRGSDLFEIRFFSKASPGALFPSFVTNT